MAYTIQTMEHSFVRFDDEPDVNHCIHGVFKEGLPVYADGDIAFQFLINTDTKAEADAIATFDASNLSIGLVSDCLQEGYDVEFPASFERYRLSDTQVLFNWEHGLQGMIAFYEVNTCFRIRVTIAGTEFCSNLFTRIPSDCYTSLFEYGNDEDYAGFNYCNSTPVEEVDEDACMPTEITFLNKETLTIPYTADLKAKYGEFPTVKVYIYDGSGNLINMGITVAFDDYPVNTISLDFGGNASGVVVIK